MFRPGLLGPAHDALDQPAHLPAGDRLPGASQAPLESRRRAVREVAGAGQRLRDRRGARAPVRAHARADARALRAAHRRRLATASCCSRETEERGFVAALRIFNPDGSEAELSGNGVREAVMYLRRHGWTDARHASRSPPPPARCARGSPAPDTCTVDMGRAQAGVATDFPSGGDDGAGTLDGRPAASFDFQFVSVGNPQCAIEVDEGLEELDLAELGRADRAPRAVPQPHQRLVLAPRGRRRDPRADLRARGGGDDVLGHRRHRRRRGRRAARRSTAP